MGYKGELIMKKISLLFILLLALLACSKTSDSGKLEEVTIGYFPNLTHIATIIALEKGYFEKEFGQTKINTKTVTNGGLFMEAMTSNEIDIGTVGPGPLINFYVKDPNYKIVSGAVNGGAVLVSNKKSGIKDLSDLKGKKVAIPVIGSTQDIMLRKALEAVDLKTTSEGGDVELVAQAPADTATLFVQDSVDASATQEPWGYILETQAGGELLLDWDEFAWKEDSTNTVVATRSDFAKETELLEAYLKAHKEAIEFIQAKPDESKALVNSHIKDLTGKALDEKEIDVAFDKLIVTSDVNASVVEEMAVISKEAGYIDSDDISGLIDLSHLEKIKE